MENFINWREVTKNEMKVEYYKEQYRLHLIRIFIVKLFKKYSSVVKFMISFVLWLSILIIWILSFATNETHADLNTTIKYGKYHQAVTVYDAQVEEMKNRGYNNTRILDLLANKAMECNKFSWLCYWKNNADLWPFQINQVHREQYNHSLYLMKNNKLSELYKYQLTYANWLIQSYEDRFCWKEAFDYIGRKYTNERRYKCVAKSYNWHPRYKTTYAELWWLKRQLISDYLFNKW